MSNSSQKNISNGRRQFFSSLIKLSGAVLLAPTILRSVAVGEEKRRGAKSDAAAAGGGAKELSWPVVEPGKDAALAMHYHHSHEEAKADAQVTKTEKSGVPFEKQTCTTCNFYKKVGSKKIKVAGKEQEVEVGTCTIFAQKLVAGPGYCNSWAKKV